MSKDIRTIKDCIPYITHEDYNVRLLGEYMELQIRRKKLGNMIQKHRTGLLDFEFDCPIKILELQYDAMLEYEEILEARIDIENNR